MAGVPVSDLPAAGVPGLRPVHSRDAAHVPRLRQRLADGPVEHRNGLRAVKKRNQFQFYRLLASQRSSTIARFVPTLCFRTDRESGQATVPTNKNTSLSLRPLTLLTGIGGEKRKRNLDCSFFGDFKIRNRS